jgi:hypothetical protein
MIRQLWKNPTRSRRLRSIALSAALAIGSGLFAPGMARAAENDSDLDGRLAGYSGKKVAIEKSSTTPAFLAFLGLVVVGCVPLFKNAKRD